MSEIMKKQILGAPVVDTNNKETRRGAIRKLLAGSAAFATGLFVAKRAEASSCYCTSFCNPNCTSCCYLWVVMCWDDVALRYFFQFDIYEGTPNESCCQNYDYGVCNDVCSWNYPC
jgi:hypothetical protein